MAMRASSEVNLTLFAIIKGPGKTPPATTVLWPLVNTTSPNKSRRTNERLNPSGASSTFEIVRLAVGPMEAETCREAAVMSKRNDRRGFIEIIKLVEPKAWVVGDKAKNTQDEAFYTFDQQLIADERDQFAKTLDEFCTSPPRRILACRYPKKLEADSNIQKKYKTQNISREKMSRHGRLRSKHAALRQGSIIADCSAVPIKLGSRDPRADVRCRWYLASSVRDCQDRDCTAEHPDV